MKVFLAGATGALGLQLIPLLTARGHEVAGMRGSSNAKAKRDLGWKLNYPTWRDGFRHGLA